MNNLTMLVALIIAVGLIVGLLGKGKGRGGKTPIKARPILTEREQPLYFRLVEALPENIVLTQVSFQALLTTRSQATRNTFDRKYADFVICSKAFNAIAVVELDDSSHKGREAQDAQRDELLKNAGYKVLRYRRVPDLETLKRDLESALAKDAERERSPINRIKPTL